MADSRNEPSAGEKISFEQALQRLEVVVHQLEEGQIGLEDGLARYEEGVKLLRDCYQMLKRAERKIELLSRVDPDGRGHSEPLDDEAVSLEEKAQTRGRRRQSSSQSAPPPASDEIDGPGRLF